MAFKIGRRSCHAVKNPVFSLAENSSALADDEKNGVLNRRKHTRAGDFDPLPEPGNTSGISTPDIYPTNSTSAVKPKSDDSVLKPIRVAPNYEEIAGLTPSISPKHAETEKVISPRSLNIQNISRTKALLTSLNNTPRPPSSTKEKSPRMINTNTKTLLSSLSDATKQSDPDENIPKEGSSSSPKEGSSSSISPRINSGSDNVSRLKTVSPSAPPLTTKTSLPALINVPKGKLMMEKSPRTGEERPSGSNNQELRSESINEPRNESRNEEQRNESKNELITQKNEQRTPRNDPRFEQRTPRTPRTEQRTEYVYKSKKKREDWNLKKQDDMCDAINEARQTDNYTQLTAFLSKMYSSFGDCLDVVKVNDNIPSNSAIKLNMEYLDYLHESMVRMPKDVRKAILRSIINCMLLKDHRGRKTIDDVRGFLVFLMNPLFTESSTYVIYAHVLRQVGCLENKEQQYLIMWFKKLPLKEFENMVARIRSFISYKLFPAKKGDIPEGEKSAWWIPNSIKVMAMLNAANDQCSPLLVPRCKFYVKGIESLDLIRQYNLWESGAQNFSFCQYPFILSLHAKRLIMQKDSETKMLLEARQSLVNKFRQKQAPNMGMLFLNIHIRRKNLLEDSLREISKNQGDLKKKLRVIFTGEPGIDLGGVSKEWFFLIIQKFFNEDYGMFTYNNKKHQWWFSMSCKENNQEYNLCGVLLGLAMYNGINLDIRFPMCVYKKLLSPAIVPYNNPHQPVGIAKFGLEDFKQVFPELGRGLQELMDYDGDVEEDLCQSFMISYTEYGQVLNRYLKPDGDQLPVTNENREEYLNLYINYMMNKSVYKQFYSFYHGFHSVCASNALLLLRPEEVETLVIGNPDFNIGDLEKITKYDGYSRSDVVIRHLWDTLHDFNTKLKRKFLLFTTGSDRVPIGGLKEMTFKITKVNGSNATHMLPMAHTCFNQLCLPPYKSRKVLQKKLSIAIENAEGFGLE